MGFKGIVEINDKHRGKSTFETRQFHSRDDTIASIREFCCLILGVEAGANLEIYSKLRVSKLADYVYCYVGDRKGIQIRTVILADK